MRHESIRLSTIPTAGWADAIALFHKSAARHALDERYAMVQLARANELAGHPDSAIAYYEKFLGSADATDFMDAHWRPLAYQWLGELYASRGETRKAIEQFSRFVELWSKAEPEMQPQVKQAQARLAALRAQAG